MTSTNDPAGQGGVKTAPGFLVHLPVAWLVVVMLLSVKGALGAWPLLFDYELPESAVDLVYASLAADAVTLLWGLYVLGLAYNRSLRFPRHFVVWQSAVVLWLLAREIYVLLVRDFMFTATGLLLAGAEIAVGLLCIAIVRRTGDAATVYSNAEKDSPPLVVWAIAAVLGVIIGAFIGFGVGLIAGGLIAEYAEISCFEGGCGYFAFFLGLLGLLAGAIGGGVFAIWRTSRRGRPAA